MLRLIASARGAMDSLMAEVIEGHIRDHAFRGARAEVRRGTGRRGPGRHHSLVFEVGRCLWQTSTTITSTARRSTGVELARIAFVALAAAAVWFRVWEPFARVSVIGVVGTIGGGWPIFHEAWENIRDAPDDDGTLDDHRPAWRRSSSASSSRRW